MYTKGDWRYSPERNIIYSSTFSKNAIVAGTKIICVLNTDIECSQVEQNANGCLLAAAPDLFDALVKLYTSIDSCIELTPAILKEAKMAILKANMKLNTNTQTNKNVE